VIRDQNSFGLFRRFWLEEGRENIPDELMTKIVGKCLGIEIEINPDRAS